MKSVLPEKAYSSHVLGLLHEVKIAVQKEKQMKILNGSILKTSLAVVFSFLFIVLTTSVTSAQSTYAQEIKVKGARLRAGITTTNDGGNALLFTDAFVNIGQYPDRILVRKVSESGKKVWQKGLHPGKQPDTTFDGRGIAELSDGGYIVAGSKTHFWTGTDIALDSEAWLVKLMPNGGIDWYKSFVESGFGSVLSFLVSSADGGFFAAGKRGPEFPRSGEYGIIVASFDSSGNMRWGKVLNNDLFAGGYFSDSPILFVTSDQELIVVSPVGTSVLKLDADGNLLWKKSLKKKDLRFTSGAVTADGGCILLFSAGAVRLDSNGDVLWKNSFRLDSHTLEGSAVTQSADGGFIVAGAGFLAKLSSNGQVISGMISQAGGTADFLLPTSDSGFVVFGSFLLKLDSNANLPGCNLFSAVTIENQKFGKLKTSSPELTTGNWTPQEGTSDIKSKKIKVTSSNFCR